MSETNQQLRSRLQLINKIFPALSYLQTRAALTEYQAIDLEIARQLFLERITGLREDGKISVFYGTLEEGGSPSIARLEQMRDTLQSVIEDITENADRLGISVVDGTTSTVGS